MLSVRESGTQLSRSKALEGRVSFHCCWSHLLVPVPFTIVRIARKPLTEKDTIVLADFANSTGDAVFDDTLKTALNVSLRQSPFLNVLSDSEVAKTLQRMTRPAGTKLTPDVARELCQRADSKAYIAGSIGSLGSQYVLGLKAVNCQSGDMLAQEQVTAASQGEGAGCAGRGGVQAARRTGRVAGYGAEI